MYVHQFPVLWKITMTLVTGLSLSLGRKFITIYFSCIPNWPCWLLSCKQCGAFTSVGAGTDVEQRLAEEVQFSEVVVTSV